MSDMANYRTCRCQIWLTQLYTPSNSVNLFQYMSPSISMGLFIKKINLDAICLLSPEKLTLIGHRRQGLLHLLAELPYHVILLSYRTRLGSNHRSFIYQTKLPPVPAPQPTELTKRTRSNVQADQVQQDLRYPLPPTFWTTLGPMVGRRMVSSKVYSIQSMVLVCMKLWSIFIELGRTEPNISSPAHLLDHSRPYGLPSLLCTST